MPKTRNVARLQWGTTTATSNVSRNRNENENKGYESEKENVGRQGSRATRSNTRTGRRPGLLGAENVNVLGAAPASTAKGEKTKGKTALKGKGVPPSAPIKRKKMPLQDITSEFLPGPKIANRGEDVQEENINENTTGNQESVNVVSATMPPAEVVSTVVPPPPQPKFTSPLPPSSPPSELAQSPSLRPESSAPKFVDDFGLSSNHSIPQAPFDPWQECDDANPRSGDSIADTRSNSDPFGFVSLERKLKTEREAALLQALDQDLEDVEQVLVADTSSPRPVRRLKRSSSDENVEPEPVVLHPHFMTPPTPHKDHQKRRRMAHDGHDVFSICSSSIESSPSPTKASARKRPQPDHDEDPLDEYNEEVDRSYEVELNSKKAKLNNDESVEAKKEEGDDDFSSHILRTLRPREKRQSPEEIDGDDHIGNKRSKKVVKSKTTKKTVNKSRSTTTKNDDKDGASEKEEEDLDEKWERERQERVDYFKRLEDYHVEKEDVFLI